MRASISRRTLVKGTAIAVILVFGLSTSLWTVVETSSGAVADASAPHRMFQQVHDAGVRLKLLRPIRVVVDNLDLAFFGAPD